jgi:hypothetical protein
MLEGLETQCEMCGGTGFIEGRSYQVKRACPHCGQPDAMLMPPLGDYSEYKCEHCGPYRVSGTTETLIENGTFDPKAARIEERGGNCWLV